MALYSFASALLLICFLLAFCISLVLLAELTLPGTRDGCTPFPGEKFFIFSARPHLLRNALILVTGLLTVCSVILLHAFINHDFFLTYVASYSNRTLPLFYRITAFWAGQDGSLLFWAWSVAVSGALFAALPSFARLGTRSKLWFGFFFLGIMCFFLLLLALWSNPFTMFPLQHAPDNGNGLNPLLQNPGMIFHPPLLFLGYGGFVVPGCLALAQTLSGRLYDPAAGPRPEEPWEQASRPFILAAWSLLTAGIVLGAWWAYMELGWGGYWAWDPVENASLIPWLVATAYLHTAVIGSRRGKLQRTNVFLMALTTISAFFATYLVRSGVVESLHAFGDGGVGTPLLVFTLGTLYLAAYIVACVPGGRPRVRNSGWQYGMVALALGLFGTIVVCRFLHIPPPAAVLLAFCLILVIGLLMNSTPHHEGKALEDLTSKEGLLLVAAWLFLALSFIILVATMWPVIISSLKDLSGWFPAALAARLPQKPMGLEPAFYNRTCLPLFALLAALLLFCPWRKWKVPASGSGFQRPAFFAGAAAFFLVTSALLWMNGIRHPIALIAAACALAGIFGVILYFAASPSLLRVRSMLAAHGVHIGLLMMVLGVAFSGPYQKQHTLELSRQQQVVVEDYTILLNELYEGESQIGPDGRPNFRFLEAELLVLDSQGAPIGKLSPQRRLYTDFENTTYAEVSTLFSLGNEIYATLLSIDADNRATLSVNINPLVNWLWIGGALMCLFPLAGFARVRRQQEEGDAPSEAQSAGGSAQG